MYFVYYYHYGILYIFVWLSINTITTLVLLTETRYLLMHSFPTTTVHYRTAVNNYLLKHSVCRVHQHNPFIFSIGASLLGDYLNGHNARFILARLIALFYAYSLAAAFTAYLVAASARLYAQYIKYLKVLWISKFFNTYYLRLVSINFWLYHYVRTSYNVAAFLHVYAHNYIYLYSLLEARHYNILHRCIPLQHNCIFYLPMQDVQNAHLSGNLMLLLYYRLFYIFNQCSVLSDTWYKLFCSSTFLYSYYLKYRNNLFFLRYMYINL